jgi:protein XagA
MRINVIRAATGLAALSVSTAAFAGAWPQDKGHGLVIVTASGSDSTKGYDANANTVDIADYKKREASALIEYGLTDDVTLIAQPSFRHVSVQGGSTSDGLGYTDLGARVLVGRSTHSVFSLQATGRIPGVRRQDSLAQVGSTGGETDLRALGGTSFKIGKADAFLEAQGAYRFRFGAPPNEMHADLTFGVRPVPRFLLLAQSFNTWSDGRGQGVFDRYRYHNVQASAVLDLDRHWSIQAGGMGTAGGKNALRERGLLFGLWRKF